MAKSRLELHEALCSLIGSRNVYFQPPENVRMKYPCIVYELSRVTQRHADDRTYKFDKSYEVTYISDNPDTDIHELMLTAFMYCQFDRRFVNDGLYHDVFTIYF